MVVVERSIDIVAPHEMVFDYVADHRNILRFMDRVVKFESTGSKQRGLGSRFRWEVLVRGLRLGAEFKVVEFEPHEWMLAETVSGPRSESWWSIHRRNGGTRTTFAAGYDLPGIFLVKLIGTRIIEQEIGSIFEESLRRLKTNLEKMSKGLVTPAGEPVAIGR